MKHLWEIEHDYYCEESNFYNNDCCFKYKSWNDFLRGDNNKYLINENTRCYNLLFRWDWQEIDEESGEQNFTGDIYYRNGKLKLFYMLQRKGIFSIHIIDVCRADEPKIIEFLTPAWTYMKDLWKPISDV